MVAPGKCNGTLCKSQGDTPMSTLMPAGEEIRKAVQWISDAMATDPGQSRAKLIEQAVFKFDLSPLEAEFLLNFFRKKTT
jgi:hypothetical protein